MIELKSEDFHTLKPFFADKKQHIPALSVLLGNYPGRVFADDAAAATPAVVWATGRWMYAAGTIDSDLNRKKLTDFILTQVVPDCRQRQEKWFEIYTDDSDEWTALFMPGADGLKVIRHMESVYEFNLERFLQLEEKSGTMEGSLVDGVIVDYEDFWVLEGHEEGISEAERRFRGLTTTGAVVKAGDQAVSVCKNNGFTVKGRYFIDVDTFAEAERGKGYGTLAAMSLIRYYLNKGQQPFWETTHENTASHKLALKLGFAPVESYPVLVFVIE